MASTYTSRIRLEKQGDGENPNTWGLRLNQNVIDLLDEAVAAYVTVSVSSADITLTANDGTTDQSRSPFIELQGTVTADLNVVVPSVAKGYVVNDSTTRSPAASAITLKTATGQGNLVKTGRVSQFICDAVSVHPVEGYTSISDISSESVNTFTNLNTFTSATTFSTSISVTEVKAVRGIMPPSTLTDASGIAVDLSNGNNFVVTLGGNRTLNNPTNIVVGQTGQIYVIQDGTGSRTLSYGSYWKFSGGTAPTLTTTANAVDLLVYNVRAADKIDTVFLSDFK